MRRPGPECTTISVGFSIPLPVPSVGTAGADGSGCQDISVL